MQENSEYLFADATDFIRDNLILNYCLEDNHVLFIKSYVRNHGIQLDFSLNEYYFLLLGANNRYWSLNTENPAAYDETLPFIQRTYCAFKETMMEYGYRGTPLLTKPDNSKQYGVIFSPSNTPVCTPYEMAEHLKDIFEQGITETLLPQYKALCSTSFAGPYTGYDQIHTAFTDARMLNDLVFFGLKDQIITRELYQKTAKECALPSLFNNFRRLQHVMCTGTEAKALRQANYIIRELIAPSYSMENYNMLYLCAEDMFQMFRIVYPEIVELKHADMKSFFTLEGYMFYLQENIRLIFTQLENRKRYSPTMTMMLSYIHQNYNKELSLVRLSEYCYSTPTALSREFNEAIGTSLSEYVTKLRIKNAQILLRTTNATIPQIAESVGFSSAKYFREVFKRETGISPQGFRTEF